ncbi:hypothetical protein OH492_12790 [Vibrio chagasii]|nr:hypothetical protein [Vibrio chagasii]
MIVCLHRLLSSIRGDRLQAPSDTVMLELVDSLGNVKSMNWSEQRRASGLHIKMRKPWG